MKISNMRVGTRLSVGFFSCTIYDVYHGDDVMAINAVEQH